MNPADHVLGLRITSTIVCFLTIGSNLLVMQLSRTRHDAQVYIFLLQLFCVSNIINSMSGWIVTNRSETFGGEAIFVTYGPGSLLGPRFSSIVDAVAVQGVSVHPIMITLMMLIRAFILFNFRFTKCLMFLLVLLVYLITFPMFYFPLISYVDIRTVGNMTDELRQETSAFCSYALGSNFILFLLMPIYSKFPIAAFVLCIVFRLLITWKLRSLSQNLSNKTKNICGGFMNLLTLDSFIILAYFIVTNMKLLKSISSMSEEADFLLSMYSHPIVSSPALIQGFAPLYFIPYIRNSLLRSCRRSHATHDVLVVSTGSSIK